MPTTSLTKQTSKPTIQLLHTPATLDSPPLKAKMDPQFAQGESDAAAIFSPQLSEVQDGPHPPPSPGHPMAPERMHNPLCCVHTSHKAPCWLLTQRKPCMVSPHPGPCSVHALQQDAMHSMLGRVAHPCRHGWMGRGLKSSCTIEPLPDHI